MKHLVQFSTGAGSAEVAWRVVQQHGPQDVLLLAADTMVEDEDNWRFGYEVADRLGLDITRLADGRTPMQVGRNARVVPNNRMAVCSRVLKRDLLRTYMEANFDPADSIVYLGFDWTEVHRLDAANPHWAPWTISAPLVEPPYLHKSELLAKWRERGIEPPDCTRRVLRMPTVEERASVVAKLSGPTCSRSTAPVSWNGRQRKTKLGPC